MAVVNDYSTGTITGISVNKVTVTQPANSATLTIADGKTLTVSNSITIAGTDSSTLTIGSGGTILYDSASSCPNVKPSLSLDFANSKTLDSRIDFTRSSTAAYTNAQGLVAYAANNQPRFDHDPVTQQCKGLLIEESRTNLLTYSENFDNAAWTKNNTSILTNITTAPDGTLTACALIESKDSTAQYHEVMEYYSGAYTYTISIFAKTYTRSKICLDIYNSTDGTFAAYFDLSAGTSTNVTGSGATATITSVGNGWYRCTMTKAITYTGVTRFGAFVCDATPNVNYIGDGVSGLYIWGAQLEAGAFATSYIPTLGSFTSRSSTATYYGSNGLIQTASANTARINYNPANLTIPGKILLEPAATNLLTYSEQFDVFWSKSFTTITANSTTAPDGTNTADLLLDDTSNNQHLLSQNIGTVSLGVSYTLSCYAKAATSQYIMLTAQGCGYQLFNLTSGTTSMYGTTGLLNGTISNVGNGWYRCTVSVSTQSTTGGFYILTSNGVSNVYTGTGTGVYIWGAQLETGTSATSYIPTTSATVTRSADVSSSAAATRGADIASITGTNFSSWYRQDEGSFSVNFTPKGSVSSRTIMSINDGTGSNYMELRYSSGSLVQYDAANSGVEQWNITSSGYTTLGTTYSYSGSYKLNDIASSINGNLNSTDSIAVIPIPTKLTIAVAYNLSSELFNGYIANLTYYPKRLSNTELQALSTQ